MKTLVTLLKLAMLVTTLSFVMSCDKNNKRTNNTAVNTGIYTYGANGSCINNQTGQQMPVTYCQQQMQNGYGMGQQQCTGNPNIYVWGQPDYSCATQPAQSPTMGYGCWKSCAQMNCSGQIGYMGGSSNLQQGYQCL